MGDEGLGKLRDLADRAQAGDLRAAVQDRDPGRVIAAVLEALQALDQDRDDVPVSHGTDDSAHGADSIHGPGAEAEPIERCVQSSKNSMRTPRFTAAAWKSRLCSSGT